MTPAVGDEKAFEYYQRGYGLRRRVLDYLNSSAPKHTLRNAFAEWETASGTKFLTPPAALSAALPQPVGVDAEAVKGRAASVICEVGALCGWPAPDCKSTEAAQALFDAGLLATTAAQPSAVAALEEIERTYWMEGKDASWRAAKMKAIAADCLSTLAPSAAPSDSDKFAYWNSLPESEKAKIRRDFHNDMFGGADD